MSGFKHRAGLGLLLGVVVAACGPIRTMNSMNEKMDQMAEMNTQMKEMTATIEKLTEAIAGSNGSDASTAPSPSMIETMKSMYGAMLSMNQKMAQMIEVTQRAELKLEKLEEFEALVPDTIAFFGYVARVLARYSMTQDQDVLSAIVDATAYATAFPFQSLLKSATEDNRYGLYQGAVQEFFRLVDARAKRVNYSLVPFYFPKGRTPAQNSDLVQDMIQLYAQATTLGTISHSASLDPSRQLPEDQWLMFNGKPYSPGEPEELIQKYPSLLYMVQKALGHKSEMGQTAHNYHQDVQDFEPAAIYMLQLHRIYLVSMTLAAVYPKINPYEFGAFSYVNSIPLMNGPWQPQAPALVSDGVMTNTPIEMLNRSAGVTEFLTGLLANNSHLFDRMRGTHFAESLALKSTFKILENMMEMTNLDAPNNQQFNTALNRAKEANRLFALQMEEAGLARELSLNDEEAVGPGLAVAHLGAPIEDVVHLSQEALGKLTKETQKAWGLFQTQLALRAKKMPEAPELLAYQKKALHGMTTLFHKVSQRVGSLGSSAKGFWERSSGDQLDIDMSPSFSSNTEGSKKPKTNPTPPTPPSP